MINELHTLSKTLESMNISTQKWHQEYKLIPKVNKKNSCYRLWISSDGKITKVGEVDEIIASEIRKYGDNQSTFPAFNIVPLYRLTDPEHIIMYEKMLSGDIEVDIDTIREWCTSNNWNSAVKNLPDMNKKVYACVVTKSEKLHHIIKKVAPLTKNAITALISAVGIYKDKPVAFRQALETCIFENLQKKDIVSEKSELYLKLLFHLGSAEKSHEKDRGSLSVLLDIEDWDDKYIIPVGDKSTTEWINKILLEASTESDNKATGVYDAFGAEYSDVGEPMPSVKLKGFDVTLRAMFKEQASQYRYGKIGDASYPITKENRSIAASALTWISTDQNQGKTWQSAGKNEIFFIYPSVLPEIPLKYAGIFAPPNKNTDKGTEFRFYDIAQEITQTLEGLQPEKIPDNIQVFGLKKMDKARTKVIYNKHCTPQWLNYAAKNWQCGCENIPPMDIWAFPAKNIGDFEKNIPKLIEQITPFPFQLPHIINNVWKQNGDSIQGKSEVKRMQYYQAMELLLDSGNDSSVKYYLNILTANSIGLIVYTGNQQHRHLACDSGKGHEISYLLSALGLLLYKCKFKKEDYMENTAYLVGNLLKISDEIHSFYCSIVRGGDVPSQLAGNSVFITASDKPLQAISTLCTRMMPYIAWAKQYRTKGIEKQREESRIAGWYLSLYEDVCTKLHSLLDEDLRFSDFDKAQLFIGYLAAFPKKNKASSNEEPDNSSISNIINTAEDK